MIEEVLGWTAAAASAAWGLPQCVRILRTKSVDGVSPTAWQATLWSSTSWAAYGMLTERAQVIWCNLVLGTATISILILVVRPSDRRRVGLLLASLVGTVATISAFTIWGEPAFTIAMGLPTLGAQCLHLLSALSSDETRGMSLSAFVAGGTSHSLWAVYGSLSGSLSIVVLNLIATTLMASTILVTQHRRRKGSAYTAVGWR